MNMQCLSTSVKSICITPLRYHFSDLSVFLPCVWCIRFFYCAVESTNTQWNLHHQSCHPFLLISVSSFFIVRYFHCYSYTLINIKLYSKTDEIVNNGFLKSYLNKHHVTIIIKYIKAISHFSNIVYMISFYYVKFSMLRQQLEFPTKDSYEKGSFTCCHLYHT